MSELEQKMARVIRSELASQLGVVSKDGGAVDVTDEQRKIDCVKIARAAIAVHAEWLMEPTDKMIAAGDAAISSVERRAENGRVLHYAGGMSKLALQAMISVQQEDQPNE